MNKKKRIIIISVMALILLVTVMALILSLYLAWPQTKSAKAMRFAQSDEMQMYPLNPLEKVIKKICQDVENFWQCSQLMEVRTLSFADQVKREKSKLIIQFADKKKMIFEDGEYEGKKADVSYALHAFAEQQGIYVINVMYYEGNIFILVDLKTKARAKVDALPYFSPSGEAFAICNADESSYTPGIFEIYRRSSAFTREYSTDEACRALRWINNQKLEVLFTDYQNNWVVTLCEKDQTWVVCQ